MPLYEYRCNQCRRVFEALQKVGETRALCPDCRSDDTERVMSAFRSHAAQKAVCAVGPGST